MREDVWLAARLGRRCYTVEAGDDPAGLPEDGFLQAKVPAAAVGRVAELEAVGFRVVDVNVRLERAPGPLADTAGWRVAPATDAEREPVLEIAAGELTASRFHLDPLIAPEVAVAVKRDWAAAVLDGLRGEGALVAERGGEVGGFLAVLAEGDRRTIDLVAVRAGRRRSGAGRALVAALARSAPGGIAVGTQIANVAALNFYCDLGFRAVAAQYVLHCHR